MSKFILIILVFCFGSAVMAEDVSDSIHKSISDSIATTADYLDDFFSEERRNVEGSRSQVVLSYVGVYDKDEPTTHNYYLDARLHLPKTEDKFRLLIRNAISYESEDQEIPFPDQAAQAVDSGQYAAALQYIFTESRLWQVSTRAGLTFGVPLDPFVRFRVRRLIQMGVIDSRIVQEFYWGVADRFRETSTVEFERLLTEKFFSRLRFGLEWGDKEDQLNYVNDLAFFHKLKSRVVIKYTIGYSGQVYQGFELQRVFINMRYRRNIYKKWMFFEVVPEFFRDLDDWEKTRFQFMLRFDLVFGKVFK